MKIHIAVNLAGLSMLLKLKGCQSTRGVCAHDIFNRFHREVFGHSVDDGDHPVFRIRVRNGDDTQNNNAEFLGFVIAEHLYRRIRADLNSAGYVDGGLFGVFNLWKKLLLFKYFDPLEPRKPRP